mgnify:CR=1 FL=1
MTKGSNTPDSETVTYTYDKVGNRISQASGGETLSYTYNNLEMTQSLEVGEVFIRSLFSLITLFLVTKMLGKKQVSQLSLFDYVIGISIGNFAAEMTINFFLIFQKFLLKLL